jgi:hypothetical protein
MLIILTLYLMLMWLVFARFKLVSWGWISGTFAVFGGAFILAVFLAMFNYLTPSGTFTVVSRVIETQARLVMSFIVSDEVTIVGMFAPNGFRTIKPGAQVKLVFDNDPGRIHGATIVTIPEGVGQGQVAVSGVLAKVGSVGGAKAYPAVIFDSERAWPRQTIGRHAATVFAEDAGVVGKLMSFLVWISSYTAYL